jgi:hypothetical protein
VEPTIAAMSITPNHSKVIAGNSLFRTEPLELLEPPGNAIVLTFAQQRG